MPNTTPQITHIIFFRVFGVFRSEKNETNPKLERSDSPELASGYKTNPNICIRCPLYAERCFTKQTHFEQTNPFLKSHPLR